MNMFSLYVFKLVTACVNVILLSSDTSIVDQTRFSIPRIKGRCCNK
jgi:NADH:ubiquinone oxidoreductase subunit B-like Fe-S oxidoreductase